MIDFRTNTQTMQQTKPTKLSFKNNESSTQQESLLTKIKKIPTPNSIVDNFAQKKTPYALANATLFSVGTGIVYAGMDKMMRDRGLGAKLKMPTILARNLATITPLMFFSFYISKAWPTIKERLINNQPESGLVGFGKEIGKVMKNDTKALKEKLFS